MAKTVINSGHYMVLGTDKSDNCEESFGPDYFKYREEWKQRPLNFNAGTFPLHLDIETTNNCNLRCVMCPRNFIEEKINKNIGYISWNLYKKIIDEAAKNRLPSIKLNYRGEPLMHQDIIRMVKYAKERGIIEVQFNTNGLLLDKEKSKGLIEAGIDRIIFSFDGATKETYEKIRAGSDYKRVVNNIKWLVDSRASMGKKRPCIRVQMVKMSENKHEIGQFIDMWTPIANRVAVSTKRDPESKAKELEHFPCPQIWQRMMICWNGEVRVCCGDWNGEIVMGNIKNRSITDIWNSEEYKDLRNKHKEGKFNEVPVCSTCEVNTPRSDTELVKLIQEHPVSKG